MGLNKNKNSKLKKSNFSFKKVKDSFWNFLLNKFGTIFTSIFLVAAVIGGFIIYKYTYNTEWSDAQKREYRVQVENSKPPFDLDKFNDVVIRINERNEINDENVFVSKDIFGTTE